MSEAPKSKGGLEGAVVADITTSLVDGENGRLVYAGYEIEDLAAHATYEEVVFLLFKTRLPNKAELEEIRNEIASHAVVPGRILEMMKKLPPKAEPMAVLRTIVSALAHYDHNSENLTDKTLAYHTALRLIGQTTTITAAWDRIRKGLEPVAPRIDLNLSENFVYMLTGKQPDPTVAAAFNVYMVLLAEHGMNASTFASRVTTATGSDMYSAVVSAIGTLKGPSHGGANAEAMHMFMEIDNVENVEKWFTHEVKTGNRRIMGIGHRIYKSLDPRAQVLKEHAVALCKATGNTRWLDIAVKLADVALADEYFISRKLYPNVDYYSAILLYSLDLEIDMFTPLFAMSRIAGWTANIIDQMGGRLIRPDANYVGPLGLKYNKPE
ncbi:MAG TPA: citrate/2-methylcitrate synthase [Aggregatilineales bacterium]|nr:citrate/2-methylcitrate synthase [Aggregatilineales bacterium]